ncbi:PREDICTED: balbiani ring protein 3-like [Polistes canadensis]|uniref:balbiani ring protein 3-like n=1 Tax=Polistes canadensis TaxID=91411 RepID=UPI000718C5AC|nr:PREDICTED: balbiani ring protein 3-like [Polistes canadensis]
MMWKINISVLFIINLINIIDGNCEIKVYDNEYQEKEVVCSNMREKVNNVRAQVKCMPRTTLMKLFLNNEYTYYPNVIPLKRCHGHCRFSCLPIRTKKTPILLQRSHINSATVSCVIVEVEEHTHCKCGCDVMEEHCNNKQIYNEEACSCDCINDEEKLKCMKKPNMSWDPDNCKCMCNKSEETCSSGLMWIRDACACAKVTMVGDN